MKKEIYLIRHSGPFVELNNIENLKFELQSERIILSVEGEKKAEKLSDLNEFKNTDVIYSSNSNRAIATVKYIAEKSNLKINVENNIETISNIKINIKT